MDVALIHAPSVYDFRDRYLYATVISEVVPSLFVFDMVPYGFLTLATYLSRRGYKVGIFNLASKMLRDREFNVEKFLKDLEADVYGIDLHWLVHAHGALEIARILKRYHPGSKVVLGGLSSTFFRREIMTSYNTVDAILLGDSTEVPFLKFLEEGPSRAPNVIWRDNGRIRENKLGWIPDNLDEFIVDHGVLVKNLMRCRDLSLGIPFCSFIEAPIAGIITVKGCSFDCVTCGGSKFTYSRFFRRDRLALKSPRAIADEVEGIANLSSMPIFFVGDLRYGDRVEEVSKLLKELELENELIFEFFSPPPKRVLEQLRRTSHKVYLQISPESPLEEVRRAFGRPYSNEQLEKMVRYVEELGFERLDLYFMMGLPRQTPDQAHLVASYFLKLREISSKVDAFVSPLAPFVDPGSRAFVNPEVHGYEILFRDLESYRRALTSYHWKYSLNYRTAWMDRQDVVSSSLTAYEELNRAKLEAGLIDERAYELAKRRVQLDREVLKYVEMGLSLDKMKESIEEVAIKLDAEVKKSLSLYPTRDLVHCIKNPLLRGVVSFLTR
ncbi:MAG: TIGR04190 family B12-binding domain/radical SAM domain protein [Candidatus Korarchaeota archaeon]|nr:TIGR04190 family B12-binding domain/radical SAM domain protein [Candidatus Korarchaeota archaeon]